MATVVATIGTKTAENVNLSGTATGSGTLASPWSIGIDADYSSNWVVGDSLTDEAATPNAYLVTNVYNSGNIEVVDYFGAGTAPLSTGGSQAKLQRAHATMATHETNLTNYGATDDAEGHIYEDISETGGYVCNDPAPSSVKYIVPETGTTDGRHDGYATPGAGVVVTQSGAATVGFNWGARSSCSLSWLTIDCNALNNIGCWSFGTNRTNQDVDHCLLKGQAANRTQNCYGLYGVGVGFTGVWENNVVFDCRNTADNNNQSMIGLHINGAASGGVYLLNNTVANIANEGTLQTSANCVGIWTANDADMNLRNNLVYDVTVGNGSALVADYANHGASTITSNNMSEDNTSPDGASYQNATNVFADAPNDDYHLVSGDDAIAQALDLTTSANIDIDGYDRNGEVVDWDCGAHNLSRPAAGNVSPSLLHRQPMRTALTR